MKFSVTQNGEPLAKFKYQWDEKTKTFSTNEDDLVLDFTDIDGLTLKTGNDCTFKTGDGCTFYTGHGCTFKTGSGCTFYTGNNGTFITGFGGTFITGFGGTFNTGNNGTFITGFGCTFTTGFDCIFYTGFSCTFKTKYSCTFSTGWSCTFETGDNCTFKTGNCCTFYTGHGCTFTTGSNCFAIRCDIPGVTEIPENVTIKFNDCKTAGYAVIEPHTNVIEIKISEQSFNELKKQLVGQSLKHCCYRWVAGLRATTDPRGLR